MKFAILLMICLFPGLASAASLYRCVGRTGQVSYQSALCPESQRTDRTIEYMPELVLPPSSVVFTGMTNHRSTMKRDRTRRASGGSRKPQVSPCARAKAKREQQLQRLGLKRTFDDLSRIDAAVRAVCNGY